MLCKENVDVFVRVTAAKVPAPGGGAVAALAAALGTALGSMCANYTKDKKDYVEFAEEYERILKMNEDLQNRLLSYIDGDAEGFLPVLEAMKMKADTEEDKAAKEEALQLAYKGAIEVPLNIIGCCYDAGLMLDELSHHTTPALLSDIAVAVQMIRAAINAAYVNVLVNIKNVTDREFGALVFEKMDFCMQTTLTMCDTIFWDVLNNL